MRTRTARKNRRVWCPTCDGKAELIPLAGVEAGQGLWMRVCPKMGCQVRIVRLPPEPLAPEAPGSRA
jgi:hypothetical protein